MNKTNKIKITQTRSENCRFAFVKELKDMTGFGLKEAKDEADKLNLGFSHSIISKFSIEIDIGHQNISKLSNFTRSINEKCTGGYIISGDTQQQREIGLLSLGLGTDEEYVRFISEFITTMPINKIRAFISDYLSKMNTEELKNTFNKLIEK
jgi:hypothetical protein